MTESWPASIHFLAPIAARLERTIIVSEQAERTHPIAGIVFAVILAGILVLLLGLSAGVDQKLLLAAILIGWGIASALVFGPKEADGH